MDIALYFTRNTFESDIRLSGSDLEVDKDLETAIVVSLFTDRRANSDDIVENGDRRGWWGDTYSAVQGDKIGSRLWLLSREKQLQSVVNRAREYATEALQWIIEDRVAQSVLVDAEIVRQGVLGLHVTVTQPTGINNFKFQYVWDQISEQL